MPPPRPTATYKPTSPFSIDIRQASAHARLVDPAFMEPTHPRDMQRRARFLDEYGTHRWGDVQWHQLAEGTPTGSLDDVIAMLDRSAFLVGLTHCFDASLMLFRHHMGLFVEDILYVPLNGAVPHPNIAQWPEHDQERARNITLRTGDQAYFRAACSVFDRQVERYGGPAKLQADVDAFRAVNTRLERLCAHVHVGSQGVGVRDRAVCMVAQYRRLRLARLFDEA